MSKPIDRKGQKFGRLTVLSLVPLCSLKTRRRVVFWLCACDCGNLCTTSAVNLKNGHTKSCGCLKKEVMFKRNSLPYGMACFKYKINTYKKRAKKSNIPFNLSNDDFLELSQGDCHYCGIKPTARNRKIYETFNGQFLYNGIDRINNDLGYTVENCVPCCSMCNRAKYTHTYQEFLEYLDRLVEYRVVNKPIVVEM